MDHKKIFCTIFLSLFCIICADPDLIPYKRCNVAAKNLFQFNVLQHAANMDEDNFDIILSKIIVPVPPKSVNETIPIAAIGSEIPALDKFALEYYFTLHDCIIDKIPKPKGRLVERIPELFAEHMLRSMFAIITDKIARNFISCIVKLARKIKSLFLFWRRHIDRFFMKFRDLEEIYDWLETRTSLSAFAAIEIIGHSYEGRPLMLVHVGNISDPTRHRVWVESNSYASDWLSSSSTLYFIDRLLEERNDLGKLMLSTFSFSIIPVSNPDGFVFSHIEDDDWTKTRSHYGKSKSKCLGVDLNSNWGWNWEADPDVCDRHYPGPKPFSELESSAMAKYLWNNRKSWFAHITVNCVRSKYEKRDYKREFKNKPGNPSGWASNVVEIPKTFVLPVIWSEKESEPETIYKSGETTVSEITAMLNI